MKLKIVLGTTVAVLYLAGQGLCAQVAGIVRDVGGKPVAGVKITAVGESAKNRGQGISAADGSYLIDGLDPDKYVFKLDPQLTGMQGGDGVAYLGADGLTVNWTVSPNALALDDAVAGGGSTISALVTSMLTPGGILVAGGVMTGAVLGGLGAAGSLGGGITTTPSL